MRTASRCVLGPALAIERRKACVSELEVLSANLLP